MQGTGWVTEPLSSPCNLCAACAFCSYLVGTETLQGVVGKLVSHIHQVVVGVDVIQAVGLGLPGGLAHVLAVPKETVEVELVGVLAVSRQTGVTGERKGRNESLGPSFGYKKTTAGPPGQVGAE